MVGLEKTETHRVYRTEVVGDTMVVTLQGDAAGFAMGAVHNEMTTLVGIARRPEVRHVVIDMSGRNYFGSVILGEIVKLRHAIREKGGRCALAGISDDMKEVLRMMRLDGLWERYPTRSMALRAMADIPWPHRVKPYIKPALITGAACLLVALYLFVPRPDYTGRDYEAVKKIWDEAQAQKAVGVSDTEWRVFSDRQKEKLAALTRKLKKTASTSRPAAQALLFIARDHAPKALDEQLKADNEDTLYAGYYLAVAKAYLDKTELPNPPKELEGKFGILRPPPIVPGVPAR